MTDDNARTQIAEMNSAANEILTCQFSAEEELEVF
jgi:hypothetical protein